MKTSQVMAGEIRVMYDSGSSVQEIRAILLEKGVKISETTICKILKNESHVDVNYVSKFNNKRKLTWDIVNWIRSDENNELKCTIIVEKIKSVYNLEISYKTVEQILKNKLWIDKDYTKIRKKVYVKNNLEEVLRQEDKIIPIVPEIKDLLTIEEILKIDRMSCIYCIYNCELDKKYIGSSCEVGSRIRNHFVDLKAGGHVNRELQKDYNLYGQDKFKVCILEKTEPTQLLEKESAYILGTENCYNVNSGSAKIVCVSDDLVRFWSYVRISADQTKCWEWQGYTKDGYGLIHMNGKVVSAHRVAFFLANPESSPEIVVRHKCNNRKCCSPYHLKPGSNKDNVHDRLSTRNDRNKLCWDDVKMIRGKFLETPMIQTSEMVKWVKENFGINMGKSTIWSILSNSSWVDSEYTPSIIKNSERYRHKLTWKQVNDLREHYLLSGSTYKHTHEYSKTIGIEITQTQNAEILKNKYWRDEVYQNRLDYKRLGYVPEISVPIFLKA